MYTKTDKALTYESKAQIMYLFISIAYRGGAPGRGAPAARGAPRGAPSGRGPSSYSSRGGGSGYGNGYGRGVIRAPPQQAPEPLMERYQEEPAYVSSHAYQRSQQSQLIT